LNVNESGHQAMLPSDEKEPFYRAPYEIFGAGQFQHVLIIGAGSGSDTAIGLKYGQVGHIDAVEIDPVIARLGAQFHPEQPFSDPRVSVHVDDGRSFLRKSTDSYDLIIFALPDSLTLTSQFSSLRLESFLFTEQSFQEARQHLTPDGAIVLYNYYRDDWLIRKLSGMLQDAFGQAPFVQSYGGWGRAGVLVDGPRLTTLLAQRPDLAQPYVEIRAPTPELNEDPNAILLPLVGQGVLDHGDVAGDVDPTPPTPATDDWPLMYLRDPALPSVYIAGLAMVAAIALLLIFGLSPGTARRGFNGHMFFLGAGFMLLETRSLVTFSLLFGSTWLVNSLVFFAILCSVMLAVFLSSRLKLRPSLPVYGLLVAALLLAYFIPQDAFLSIGVVPLRYALASLVAFLPVFVANLVFAGSFGGTGPTADVAFASNLIGIMLGGMGEYLSLLTGYQNLLLIVIGFYLLSAFLLRRRQPETIREPETRVQVAAT
jgi:SAM-dependent methyltransferase